MESMTHEITAILADPTSSPGRRSIALLSAAMLGNLELYDVALNLLGRDIGVPQIGLLEHKTCTALDIWNCCHAASDSFRKDPETVGERAWLLGRLCMAAGYMTDESRAMVAAQVLDVYLTEREEGDAIYSVEEVWAHGYLTHHRGRRHRDSELQIANSPGWVQKPTDAFGYMAHKTADLVRRVPASAVSDSCWAKTMLLSAVGASGAWEHWSRYAWCNVAASVPVGDYKAWAHAMVSAAASAAEIPDAAALHADRAMTILRQHAPSDLAPHDAMLTVLTLRSSFVDLHKLGPGFSKKVAKRCCPKLPFVVRGVAPALLGAPRAVHFPLKHGSGLMFANDGKMMGHPTVSLISSV